MSGHSVPTPMHLRLGQKEKVWTGEYVDEEEEEEDRMDRIEAIGEEDDENNLDGEDDYEGKGWDNNEDEEEEEDEDVDDEGDHEGLEWDVPEFSSQSDPPSHPHYGPQQQVEEGGDAPVEDAVSRAEARDLLRFSLSRNRSLRRLKRWQRLRTRRGLGIRLIQHWKSWRQRAQWVNSQGNRVGRRMQRYSLYGKQRRTKRYRQSQYTDGEDDSDSEMYTESDRGTRLLYFRSVHVESNGFLFKLSLFEL